MHICWMEGWRRERGRKERCETNNKHVSETSAGSLGTLEPLAHCYSGMIYFSQFCISSVYCFLLCAHDEHRHRKSLSRYMYSITHTTTHPHTHTHTHTSLPVVDNSLLATPDASAGKVVIVLKQQERTSAETFYGPCPTADLGRASLFQILTSTAPAVEIPTLTPDQHLRLISLHRAAVGIGSRQQGRKGGRAGATLPPNGSGVEVCLVEMT